MQIRWRDVAVCGLAGDSPGVDEPRDEALELPGGFRATRLTSNALAGIANEERRIWAVQFHPEVTSHAAGAAADSEFCF